MIWEPSLSLNLIGKISIFARRNPCWVDEIINFRWAKLFSSLSVDFLAGDGKSPRHLALQPMYVSYTSLTQQSTSKRSTLSRQHHQQPKLHQRIIFNDLSRQQDEYSLNSLGSETTLPSTFSSVSRNYKKPAYKTDSCETTSVLPRSKQRLVRADQIRNSMVDVGVHNAICRSKSHERLSRRTKKSESASVRPKSLCGRSNFLDNWEYIDLINILKYLTNCANRENWILSFY